MAVERRLLSFFLEGEKFLLRERRKSRGCSEFRNIFRLSEIERSGGGIRKIRKIYKLVGNRGNSRKLTSTEESEIRAIRKTTFPTKENSLSE